VLLALIPLSDWLGKTVMLDPAAKWYLDWLLRQRDRRQEHFTRIIRIDTEDHKKVFDARSPLPSVALRQSVCALLRRGPAVLVVDLDTSNEREYQSFKNLNATNLVWARDATYVASGTGFKLAADPVLGGQSEPPYGIAVMPSGFDGRIREWTRFITIDGRPRPTLAWRAVVEYCNNSRRTGCPSQTELNTVSATPLNFYRDLDFETLNLSDFLTDSQGQFRPNDCDATQPDPRFENRIVLLGGFYSKADLHDTPWGTRTGVELVAMAIEQELEPEPLNHLALPFKWALKILIALGIAFIHCRFRPIPAVLATLGLLPPLILISGYLAFRLSDAELAVTPFLVGILIEQLVSGAEKAEDLAHTTEHGLRSPRSRKTRL
jgi:hypothetical protein